MPADQMEIGSTAVAEVPRGNGHAVEIPETVEQAAVYERLMENALAQGKEGVEALRELVEIHRQAAREDAERALVRAIASFHNECPPILKTKAAGDVGGAGTKKGWMYAPLDEALRTIRPHLANNGLSITWDSAPTEKGERETVCKLWHVRGACREARVVMPAVDLPKAKAGSVHTIGAAIAYGQRYSMFLVLGLTGEDTDGVIPDREVEFVDEEQLANLHAVWDEVKANVNAGQFFEYFGCDTLATLDRERYQEALQLLMRKRK